MIAIIKIVNKKIAWRYGCREFLPKIVNIEMAKGDHSFVCFSAGPIGTNLVGRLNGVDGDVFVTG